MVAGILLLRRAARTLELALDSQAPSRPVVIQHEIDPPLRSPEPPGHSDLRSHLQPKGARDGRHRPFQIRTARDRVLTARHAQAGPGVTLVITYSSIGPRRAALELIVRRAGTRYALMPARFASALPS